MKKITIVLAAVVLCFSSCKKWYSCTCYYGSQIEWEGEVEATSKAKAVSITEKDTGADCTCI